MLASLLHHLTINLQPSGDVPVSLCTHAQELDPAAAHLVQDFAAAQAAAGGAPITLIDGLAVHSRYLQPLLPHPDVHLTSWVAKVHALCWVTSFQQVRGAGAALDFVVQGPWVLWLRGPGFLWWRHCQHLCRALQAGGY